MYQFSFIKDSRFSDTPQRDVENYHKAILEKLAGLPIKLKFGNIYPVYFGKPEPNVSYRRTYYMSKTTRKITWNTIFGLINTIQAPYYKRI